MNHIRWTQNIKPKSFTVDQGVLSYILHNKGFKEKIKIVITKKIFLRLRAF